MWQVLILEILLIKVVFWVKWKSVVAVMARSVRLLVARMGVSGKSVRILVAEMEVLAGMTVAVVVMA
uniref:Uncharacterized protein n=1 Tax=Cannabis sativa TaxID=3483 RepID=A0A803QZG1_CANSA